MEASLRRFFLFLPSGARAIKFRPAKADARLSGRHTWQTRRNRSSAIRDFKIERPQRPRTLNFKTPKS